MTFPRLRQGMLIACLLGFAATLGAQVTTVVLLRHAERESLFDGDSPLSEAGRHRAQALVPLLEGFRPAVLYASELRRTQQTLAPLAAKVGLRPLLRPKDGSEALAAEILRDLPGRTVLVCWHHDLLKKIARALGVKGSVPYWSLDTYDRIWIVTIPPQGEARLVEKIQALSAPAAVPAPQGR